LLYPEENMFPARPAGFRPTLFFDIMIYDFSQPNFVTISDTNWIGFYVYHLNKKNTAPAGRSYLSWLVVLVGVLVCFVTPFRENLYSGINHKRK
jgi:hypothetical protein